MGVFSEIPADSGVRILAEHAVMVCGYEATHQWWLDDDSVQGDSVIFRNSDVKHLSDSEVIKVVRDSSFPVKGDEVTISRKDLAGFVFVSFNFLVSDWG